MNRRVLALAAVGSVTVFALCGCTSPGPSPTETSVPSVDTRYTPIPASTAPAPTPGGTSSTVANPAETSLPPVKITSTATVPQRATVVLTKIAAVQTTAVMPGEVSGPGLSFTLKVTNTGSDNLDVTSTLITMAGTSGTPGAEMSGPPAKPMTGSIKPGESATGVFVFAIDKQDRKNVTVAVTIPSVAPVVVFKGQAPS